MLDWSKLVAAFGALGTVAAVLLTISFGLKIMAGLYPQAQIPLFAYAVAALVLTLIVVCLVAIFRGGPDTG